MASRVLRRARVFSLILLLVALLAGLRAGAAGTTRYVDDTGCSPTGPGTPTNPYCRIQDAICASAGGDTVSVAPGTYNEAIRMRPGVSVISQQGAALTTVNAAGQPCTDNTFCAKRPGSTQCSVVTFASGHTSTTVLSGFTITGGAGLPQTGPDKLSGGGIYIFSSPTIINNVITNNVLAGPSPNNQDMRGAGVYVSVGSPLISSNTIQGNRAIPPSGTSSAITFGYGGGVWLSPFSEPVLSNNIIQGNHAGDPDALYSLGVGGGVVSFPGGTGQPGGHLIDRNLIADNVADGKGGGVALMSDPNTATAAVVTNNVIVGNSAKNGGGVYEYFVEARVTNNTVTGNTAFLGGGVFLGQGDVAFPVTISNNIIEGNNLLDFGEGGGIYKLDLDAAFEPAIASNDLWGNERNNVGGDRSDANTIGVNGNFSSDPKFVNRAARNFHLQSSSPAIDRAAAAGAPAVDKDNQPRGVDGNGTPNNPVAGDNDVGAYEFSTGGCTPLTETCDGIDNNCDTLVDEGFPNHDGDAQANCVDPDDDNDTASDGADCAPLDATAFGLAAEVAGLDVTSASPTSVVFTPQAIGSGTRYEILSGLVSRLRTAGFQESFCAAASATGGFWEDPRPAPRVNDAWFYLIRAVNNCGVGTLGTPARDAGGAGDACALGIGDGDADGSPSDLDCDDGNAARSPLHPELCDTIDNNCSGAADEGNPEGGASCGPSEGTCEPGVTLCSGGSLVCSGGVGPGPELCDGLDNDCDGTPDDNVVDSDGDGQNDCLDGDDDNDTVADGSDCAPRNAGAFGTPTEVQGLDALGTSPTSILWTNQAIGSATVYDVVSGSLVVPGPVVFASGTCLGTDTGSPFADTRGAPPAGEAWYYLVRSRNACGAATYGSAARDTSPPCP